MLPIPPYGTQSGTVKGMEPPDLSPAHPPIKHPERAAGERMSSPNRTRASAQSISPKRQPSTRPPAASTPLHDGNIFALVVPKVDLPRASDSLLLIRQQLLPLGDPTGGAADGKQHREHIHWQTQGLVDNA